ncbi:MAG: NAD(P)H-hydrate dehydratase [Acidiferrobacteraceae bacterium]
MTVAVQRPQDLPEALYDAAGVQTVDREAMRIAGLADEVLARRAATAALSAMQWRYPEARRVAILAGPGKNGRDGWLLAATPRSAAVTMEVLEPGTIPAHTLAQILSGSDLIVDALFGIGLRGSPEGQWRDTIEAANHSGRPIFALDVPSGIDASTGGVPGVAVGADATLCFVALKAGLFTGDALDYRGTLLFDDLDVPPEAYAQVPPVAVRMRDPRAIPLPIARRNTHKGEAGSVLIVGGGPGMPGAVRLAGEAAYAGGAGVVTIATHGVHAACLNVTVPELIVHGVDDLALLEGRRFDALAIGSGLGHSAWAQALWSQALTFSGPMVVDGDALRLLARSPVRRPNFVLTPHPGEAAALLGCSAGTIQSDRRSASARIAETFGGVCVLKGAGTIVAGANECFICDCGSTALATAGTGDVLVGLTVALLARGLPASEAARLAVMLHGRAGEHAARPGLRASGIIPWIWRDLDAP